MENVIFNPYTTVRLKKVYTLNKVSPYIFRECSYIWGAKGHFYEMTPKSDDIVCLSEHKPRLGKGAKSSLDRSWDSFWLLSTKLRVVKRLRKKTVLYSDGLVTIYERTA